jgi:hypothetical protein
LNRILAGKITCLNECSCGERNEFTAIHATYNKPIQPRPTNGIFVAMTVMN